MKLRKKETQTERAWRFRAEAADHWNAAISEIDWISCYNCAGKGETLVFDEKSYTFDVEAIGDVRKKGTVEILINGEVPEGLERTRDRNEITITGRVELKMGDTVTFSEGGTWKDGLDSYTYTCHRVNGNVKEDRDYLSTCKKAMLLVI